MSDFDEEAERERLREKYERDREKREVTERMSELLLKGATMTNAHCEDCGDPIFRYDGQEFCASCGKAVERSADESDDDADANGEGEQIEVARPSDETRVQFGDDEGAPDEEASSADDSATQGRQPQGEQSGIAEGGSHLQAAHAALSREVVRLARMAANCEDLGQERELLAATREAAEALSAVREAGR